MNIEKFNKLKNEFKSNVVWKDEDGYNFSMSDELLEMDEEELDEYKRIEKECEEIEEIEWYVGYGDDVINCIVVKELSDMDKVKGLEEFIEKYVGNNCYSDEDEEE